METEHDDEDEALRQERLLQRIVVAHLAEHEDIEASLRWAKETLPMAFADVFTNPDPVMNARGAYWLARAFGNAMPLASNGFQPKPLPEPKQDEPCPCGSGDTYADCCLWAESEWAQSERQLKPEHLWPILFECRSDAYWLRAEKAGKLPNLGLLTVAALNREHERWQPLRKLIEARLAVPSRCTDPEVAHLVDWLCDAYDHLHSTRRKKLALLRRFAEHETPAVRGAANRRLATVLLDAGDRDAAWAAAQAARQAQPKNPETALFEMTMLVGDGEIKAAAKRARYWQQTLAEVDDIPESVFEALDDFAEDPARAFEDTFLDEVPPLLRELLEWIDQNANRPLPRLRWKALDAEDDDETLRDAYVPVVARNRRRLEEEWLAVSGMEKPFSTQPFSGAEQESWRRCGEWVPWLRRHTHALDSVTILDDLAMLLTGAQEHLGGPSNRWVSTVHERGEALLAKHGPPERKGKLPWVVEPNRPALRLLASFIEGKVDDWEGGRLERAMGLYLRLNPNDNHGFRCPLVNHLLTEGRDADALACADRYPNDMFVETRYGAVLALYRLGRRAEAETRLDKAKAHLPRVLRYLVPAHIRRPKVHEDRVSIGGDDQAWLYRDAMREVWAQTDGVLDWLRGFQE